MELGLHLSSFTYPAGPQRLAADLGAIAAAAEDAGFAKLSVMDHLFQIEMVGPAEQEMLEAYTALGFLAARTSKIELLAWVTAAIYREPGLLAKAVTTLDVLSGGRAWLGIGAGWNEQECVGLGLPFPAMSERFERLEEAVQIFIQMCGDSEEPFEGKHYHLGRTLNSPQSLQRPHPPILIGGSGEKKTLRMVAQYAQACNLFGGPEVAHKLEVLRGHCEALGRDYDDIQKTVILPFDVTGPDPASKVDTLLGSLRDLAGLGITHVHGSLLDVGSMTPLETMAEQVIPVAADF